MFYFPQQIDIMLRDIFLADYGNRPPRVWDNNENLTYPWPYATSDSKVSSAFLFGL